MRRMAAGMLAAVTLAATPPAIAADLRVTVTGVAHDQGTVNLLLHDSAHTFRESDKARARASLPAMRGEVTTTFPGLAAGTYALIVYHDEDGDGRMDRFLGMIPTEGYGLSNDPEVNGPPQFEECAFELHDGPPAEIVVPLHY